MSARKAKSVAILLCLMLSVVCAATALTACDRSSAPVPTDAEWTFVSLTVTGEQTVTVYHTNLGGEYNGMEVNADMVTADFTENRVVLTFANGDEIVGGWKKKGESGGASLIEYDFVGEKETGYGTCGKSTSVDGKEKMNLYIVCGELSFYFECV